jgi:hypothetical protein
VSEIPLIANELEFMMDDSADCPPGKLLTPLAIADGLTIPDIPGTLLIAPDNALKPASTPPDATAASTAGILPVAMSTPALFNILVNEVTTGEIADLVSVATCSNLFFKLIAVKFWGTPACSGLNESDMAANADFDIPFAASANPANPVISGGLIFRKESILGNPGILGIDDIMPLREVTMEPAEPVVIASADEKLPELIALATLAIEGSVAIIVYYLY